MTDVRGEVAALEAERPDLVQLARLSSLAAIVEPALLRRLRLETPGLAALPAGVEADLWFSPLAHVATSSELTLRPDVLDVLRTQLSNDRHRAERNAAKAIVGSAHAHHSDMLRLEERIIWAVVTDDAADITASWERVAATLRAGDERAAEVVRWYLQARRRLPRAAMHDPVARLISAAAALHVDNVLPPEVLEADRFPDAVSELAPAALPQTRVGVRLTDGGVRFVSGEEGPPLVTLPATRPLVMEVRWQAADDVDRSTVVRADPGSSTALESFHASAVLRTLDGQRYAVRVAAPVETDVLVELGDVPASYFAAALVLDGGEDDDSLEQVDGILSWLQDRDNGAGLSPNLARVVRHPKDAQHVQHELSLFINRLDARGIQRDRPVFVLFNGTVDTSAGPSLVISRRAEARPVEFIGSVMEIVDDLARRHSGGVLAVAQDGHASIARPTELSPWRSAPSNRPHSPTMVVHWPPGHPRLTTLTWAFDTLRDAPPVTGRALAEVLRTRPDNVGRLKSIRGLISELETRGDPDSDGQLAKLREDLRAQEREIARDQELEGPSGGVEITGEDLDQLVLVPDTREAPEPGDAGPDVLANDLRRRLAEGDVAAGVELGSLLADLSDPPDLDRALRAFDQAASNYRDHGNPVAEATMLNQMGMIHYRRGESDAALVSYEQALTIQEKVGDRAGQAATLRNIGIVHYGRGDLNAALDSYEQALRIQEGLGDRAGQATSLDYIGEIHLDRGDPGAALDAFQRALPIHVATLGPDHPAVARDLNSMGSVYQSLGNLPAALEAFERALAIYRKVGNRTREADTLDSLESVRRAMGGRDRPPLP